MQERSLIEKIKLRFSSKEKTPEQLLCGIGDDCAVFEGGNEKWLISTDTLVENRHFDLRYHPPYKLGCKAVAVNLSDIAAMGGTPKFATISVSIPEKLEESWLESFINGIHQMVSDFNVQLIGGDTVSANELSITVTVLGVAEKPVYRSGATPGDSVYVSGYVGSAAGGLFLLQEMYRDNCQSSSVLETKYKALIGEHLNITPQVTLGRLLASLDCITAMQDVSDGIATDLAHIAKESKVQAVIVEETLPIHSQLKELAREYHVSSTELALFGGEDFQLVFTVSGGRAVEEELEKKAGRLGVNVTKIGYIEEGKGDVLLVKTGGTEIKENITFLGYEHT